METKYAVAQHDRNSVEYLDLPISLIAKGILAYVRAVIPGPFPTFTLSTILASKTNTEESDAEVQSALDELVAAGLIRVIK